MNNEMKILGLLGLAQRARQLVTGEDLVIRSLRSQQIKFIFLSSDAGKAVAKKIHDQCQYYGVPMCAEFSKQKLSQAIGQPRTVIGVTQTGFAKRFIQLTNNQK
ncbi:MAG TPA: ribosomal L7Ae/L30e/S12e/Gadd45 family protein [Candidatus Limosilactobacillus merdigallinarum]|uniref:Ribosomal L7Ae/L30e/S12e/Gadd45 family protein n=1 Tax=Candidatus Limosilactobacillus merdigallinarum TaxID=2838652 RepID=A0A9D2ALP8_9LACO|nr:ribosomal L7Ae/L30e/S12e/Gadd45 family protein [Candidatus Limosilactobacillus merdigallinarum]